MKTYLRIAITVLLLGFPPAARALEPAAPEAAGFIPDRMGRVDRVIERAIGHGEVHGAVALVARNGRVVYQKAFGHADREAGRPMTTGTIFRIASMTKALTTVAAMQLYEQGHFQLNDPLARYLPEFGDMQVIAAVADDGAVLETVPATRPIRVIDLLAHTAGFGYPFIPSKVQNSYLDAGIIDGLTARPLVLADQMELLAEQPLLFEPGTEFAYGLNTDVLGYLVEVVSGLPLDRYFATRITGPLGMEDTYFYLPEDKRDRLATLYAWVEGKGLVPSRGREADIRLDNPDYPVEGAGTYFSGGAGLSSTARDYARFTQMLLNEGELEGVRILGRKAVELLRTARVDWDGDQRPDFGLGFAIIGDIGKAGELGSAEAYSWGGAFNTSFWIDPQEQLLGVLMTQARPVHSDLAGKFRTAVYQALE
jgi:CubicO group peptidase (beta-lactamase class C family)